MHSYESEARGITGHLLRWAPRPIRKPGHLLFAIALVVLLTAICVRTGIGIGVHGVALAGIGLSSVVSAFAVSIVLVWTAEYLQFRRRVALRQHRQPSLRRS